MPFCQACFFVIHFRKLCTIGTPHWQSLQNFNAEPMYVLFVDAAEYES